LHKRQTGSETTSDSDLIAVPPPEKEEEFILQDFIDICVRLDLAKDYQQHAILNALEQ
jgi:hypothetical protein